MTAVNGSTATTDAPASRTKPRFRGVSHEAGFYAAVGAGLTLVGTARSLRVAFALAVYALGLSTMFGISALYHVPTWSPEARRLMKRLDHCGIFLLIAGTYTPLCLLVLKPEDGLWLLAAVWAGAAAGIAQALLWIDAPKPITAAIYIALGWLAATSFGAIWRGVGTGGMVLLLLGGLFYTVGGVIYGARRPDPLPKVFGYHEIFHALVLAAAICHFAMILRVARGL